VAELTILGALPVTLERDGWDWLLYALSVTAATTAIVLFLPWALERRRRPEVQFHWRFSPDGDPTKLALWPADNAPEIDPTRPFLVEAAILNTGDTAGGDTLINFVVPDCFDLRQRGKPDAEPLIAGNDTAGLPPEYRAVFFASRAEPWTPGNWFMWHYRLQYSTAKQCERSFPVRLLFDVSDSRFNSHGRRWLPSILPPSELQGASAGMPWPPVPTKRRWRIAGWRIGWVRPTPPGRVVCAPGDRRDIRDLIVMPADGGQEGR
jgi:hypothetical protein